MSSSHLPPSLDGDQFQPVGDTAAGTPHVRQIVDDDGNLALSAEEIGLIQGWFITPKEFLTMPEDELDALKLVYNARLKWGEIVSPEAS